MERNVVYNEDCLEAMRRMPDGCVDLIVTDPPYVVKGGGGNGELTRQMKKVCDEDLVGIKDGFDKDILDEMWRLMKVPNIYIWCSKAQIPDYMDWFVQERGCSFEIISWVKDNAVPIFNNHYMLDREFCLYFRKGGYCQPISYECAKTIYYYPINKRDKDMWGHPTIKPVEIIKVLVANSSREGDLVLDPFIGSGTTAVACMDLKRDYVGMELDKKWFDVCQRRIDNAKRESWTLW